MSLQSEHSESIHFDLKIENFSGPFDLLIHLLDDKKMDICDVSISQITDTYLKSVLQIEHKNLNQSSEFLLMAAALIEFKSRSLLPQEEDDETLSLKEQLENERLTLLNRLIQYKMYKKASSSLVDMEKEFHQLFSRAPINQKMESSSNEVAPIILKNVSIDHLLRAFKKAWDRSHTAPESTGQILDDPYTVREKMDSIIAQLHQALDPISFESLFSENFNRMEVITCFLAILELTRLKLIALVQGANFGDIAIMKLEAENYLVENVEDYA